HIAVQTNVAGPAGDELGVLTAEIEDEDLLVVDVQVSLFACGSRPTSLDAVVRRLLGDDDVVDVALAEPAGGDADEARVLPQLLDGVAAGVAHAAPDAAEHLVNVHRQAALVRDAPLDSLGDELLLLVDVALEVALLAAALHRPERAHTAIALVAAALVQDDLARRLLGPGEERADHHRARAGGQRLHDVAGVLDAPVG